MIGLREGKWLYRIEKEIVGWGKSNIQIIPYLAFKGNYEEALHTVSVLAEGGTIVSPLQPHPEPDDAGGGSITKDRFGYTWIITCLNSEKKR